MSDLPKPSRVYWVTRDSGSDGRLSDWVDVWDARPALHRCEYGSGTYWLDPDQSLGQRYGNFPYDAVAAWGHAMPETPHESIRVEIGFKSEP